jgi:chorismate mutase
MEDGMDRQDEKFYLIRHDILPEAIMKTVEAKRLLESGQAETVHEAVDKVGLSRSAYYKYKDGIFPFDAIKKEMIVTITLYLEHRSGILSKVLSFVASKGGNVLTINQTIPLQGMASVAMSIDIAGLTASTAELVDELKHLEGVKKANLVGRS